MLAVTALMMKCLYSSTGIDADVIKSTVLLALCMAQTW
jgi:hypothetical protein